MKTLLLTANLALDIVHAERVCQDEGIGPTGGEWRDLVIEACVIVADLTTSPSSKNEASVAKFVREQIEKDRQKYPECKRCRNSMTHGERDICNSCRSKEGAA